MNRDDTERFGRDEPNFQDENQYDDQDINRQFNDPANDIDDEEEDDNDDYSDVDDDDLEKDGDLDDDDEDDNRPGDLYKDVDLSLLEK
ncbi:hypothetical protein SAMN05444397_11247 [Flavobacterium aquidurense]|uniref:Uncharacterized protein n=1 Tax=Flavobacterium frigidimaris TaxID=262320 RepID=A0ABX4BKD8_FLAFR|nr:hypothetical protein [Flavobacterium frigidimaris]OXA75743.1 hypothetical protein B0A65_21250 [Flavobacterium frigidimaris]SDZ63848.1 hypothetical protein SAMN05444397_11247 [Flavobacterium aquidurense]